MASPRTIMLVHGFWMTPRSWEQWIPYYEAKGYRVVAPAYPGFEVEVEALNEDPTPIVELSVPDTVAHLGGVIDTLDEQPIIIGHSAGGLFTQLLLARGYGACGVGICSAPTEGVRVTPGSQLKTFFPILRNPANRHRAVAFSPEQFHEHFANTMSAEQARAFYDRCHVPASGRLLFDSSLANLKPGHQDTWVDYDNEDRPPLLFISAEHDHVMPPSIQRSNAKHYKAGPQVEVKEYPGKAHSICAEDGWQQVADHALTWALEHARPRVTTS